MIVVSKYSRNVFIALLFCLFCSPIFGGEYSFATYNIRCEEIKDALNGDGWINRKENLCNLILFNDFDMFGVQEATRNQITDMMKKIGNEYACIEITEDEKTRPGAYNAIFYKKKKFDLLDQNTIWLSDTPNVLSKGWDSRFYRACIWGHFKDKIKTTDIWFFNVHIDASGKLAKLNGCKLLLDMIKKTSLSNVILVGDFNMYKTDSEYKTISNSNCLFDAYDLAQYKWAPTGSFNGFNYSTISSKCLDHLLVSKNVKVQRYGILNNFYFSQENISISNLQSFKKGYVDVKVHLPSDHYPVCIKVELDE